VTTSDLIEIAYFERVTEYIILSVHFFEEIHSPKYFGKNIISTIGEKINF
jgi:hypothetical protein